MRVLVCGGRDFDDREAIARALRSYKPKSIMEPSEAVVIHGGAPGADTLADEWCEVFGVRKRVFLADWKRHGKAAGPIRNAKMIREGRPDVVIAFPGGQGTADMCRQAEAAGIPIVHASPARPTQETR